MYGDNEKKLYVVLNKNHDISLLLNAACHLTAGIVSQTVVMPFHRYDNQFGVLSAYISHYPIVILQAKNSNQLKSLTEKCIEEIVEYNYFTTSMISASAEQQKYDTYKTPINDMDFVAVALLGDRDKLTLLTRKFSVFK